MKGDASMNNFKYYTPTEVVFGKDTEMQVADLIKKYGGTKVLVHYGGGSVKRSGLLDRVKGCLEAADIPYKELGGVVPNPRLSLVREGVKLVKEEGIDLILAIGGGSVIDSSKAIGYGAKYDGDVWDIYAKKAVPQASLPVGAILTIAAAGSEMSDSSVITNEDGMLKVGVNSDVCRVKFAIMNPELTATLPAYQTACGCTDIIMHTLERYFTQKETMELTNGIAAALIKTVMHNAIILRDDPTNYNARAEVMWASSLSHNGLTGCGNGGNDFATHKIEHEVSGLYDVTHGAGLAALWGSWARYVMSECMDKFVMFATDVMGVDPDEIAPTENCDTCDNSPCRDEKIALAGVEAMEAFFREINMPTSLSELGIEVTDEDIQIMADKCEATAGGPLGAAKKLVSADFVKIYNMAR